MPQRKRSQYHTSESKRADQGKPSGETAACASTSVRQKNRTPPSSAASIDLGWKSDGERQSDCCMGGGGRTDRRMDRNDRVGYVLEEIVV